MATEIAVSIITVPLVEDAPNPAQDAIVQAIIQDRDVTEVLLEFSLTSFDKAAEKYFNYGRDTFTNGLPESTLSDGVIDRATVRKLLTGIEGEAVAIVFAEMGVPSVDFISFEYLQINQNYDPTTKLVGTPSFGSAYPVYFHDSKFEGVGQVEITFREGHPNPNDDTYVSVTYPITNLDINDIYYHVTYYKISDPLTPFIYWTYNTSLGLHPTLDSLLAQTPESTYFPIVPIRTNKVNLIDVPGDLRDTSEHMLDFMTIDLANITTSIVGNPDIADIDDVYLMYGVNIQSTVPATMDYLWNFFHGLSFNTRASRESFGEWQNTRNKSSPVPLVANRLNIEDGEAKFVILYNYITVNLVTGVIGSIGDVTRENIFRDNMGFYDERENWNTVNALPNQVTSRVISNSSMVLRKQVSEDTYIEIDINGLNQISWVYQDYTVVRNLEDSMSADMEFFIPLNHATLNSFTNFSKTRSEVLYDSLKLVFHAVVLTKLAWYQTSAFKFLVVVVLVVVSLVTLQPQLATIVSAFDVGLTAGLWVALEILAESYVVGLTAEAIVSELLKHVDSEIALALAVVVTIITMVYAKKGPSALPWADEILRASQAVIKGVATKTQEDLRDLLEDTAEFLKDVEEKQEEIDAANDLLGSSIIDPLLIIENNPIFLENETPFDFYQRTTHNTNPGVRSLDAIENFVSGALKLPDTIDLTNLYV